MSDGAKALIVVAICFLFLIVAAVAGAAYWWSHHSRDLGRAVMQKYEAGSDFGKKTDNQGCVDEALSQYKKNPGFKGAISANLFMRACLDASKPTPGFCESIPRRMDFMKSAAWQQRKCREAGISDSMCPQLFAQIQEYCETGRRHEQAPVFTPEQ